MNKDELKAEVDRLTIELESKPATSIDGISKEVKPEKTVEMIWPHPLSDLQTTVFGLPITPGDDGTFCLVSVPISRVESEGTRVGRKLLAVADFKALADKG